jgi:FkbM family methyltransferase
MQPARTPLTPSATVQIASGRKSFSLELPHPDDHIARTIRQSGTFYEAEMLSDLQSRLFFPQVAVDVGAHVGNHTIFFAGVLNLTTYAFEPNPAHFSLLRSNLRANGLDGRCTLFNVALGAEPGHGTIDEGSATNSGMSRVTPTINGPVEVTSLDTALPHLERLDVLKIDVEGTELDVVRGVRETLRRLRPVSYIEIAPENFGDVYALLSSCGYVCWKRFNATATFLFLPAERFVGSERRSISQI